MPRSPKITLQKVKKEQRSIRKSGKLCKRNTPTCLKPPKLEDPDNDEKRQPGRKRFFSEEEIQILIDIVEKKKKLNQRITRKSIAKKFAEKTGRKIENLQRISDVRRRLNISWQKVNPKSRRQQATVTKERATAFAAREKKRVPRYTKWFVDQIKLPDNGISGYGYGTPGEGAVVERDSSSGTGTGILSCNWDVGMGPFMYVRNSPGHGTNRNDVIKYLNKKLFPAMPERSTLYLDNSPINTDRHYHSIEAAAAKHGVKVRYLPPNSTHLISPLDKQPFACLRNLWNSERNKNAKTASATLKRCVSNISRNAVRTAISESGY